MAYQVWATREQVGFSLSPNAPYTTMRGCGQAFVSSLPVLIFSDLTILTLKGYSEAREGYQGQWGKVTKTKKKKSVNFTIIEPTRENIIHEAIKDPWL